MLKSIIKFSAEWCGPCKVYASTFHEVSKKEEFKDLSFQEFDIEDEEGSDLVEKYRISSVPATLLLDENKEIIKRISGNIPRVDLVNIINLSLKD